MTAVDWLKKARNPHPGEMLDLLEAYEPSERKVLLLLLSGNDRGCFQVALTPVILNGLNEFAEGRISREVLSSIYRDEGIRTFALVHFRIEGLRNALATTQSARKIARDLIKDIFGNPFRPITFLPEWRTSTVLALAQGIYSGRAFDRMPILADALQDANCDNEEILNHCREPGPHCRGCFLIDLILGRE